MGQLSVMNGRRKAVQLRMLVHISFTFRCRCVSRSDYCNLILVGLRGIPPLPHLTASAVVRSLTEVVRIHVQSTQSRHPIRFACAREITFVPFSKVQLRATSTNGGGSRTIPHSETVSEAEPRP